MPFILKPEECTFILIDVQDSLFKTIHNNKFIEQNMRLLLRLREILNIDLIVTTQNAPRLGPTLPSLSSLLPDSQKQIDKMVFSCLKVSDVITELNIFNHKTLLLFGIEAHICVYQTAIEAITKGYNVIVATDAVSSRTVENK